MKFNYSISTLLIILLSFQGNSQIISQCDCLPIQVTGTEVTVSNIQELELAIDQANNNNGNMTIVLLPGEYQLSSNLRGIRENMANTTIMGSTENNRDVIVKGLGWDNNSVTHIFNVAADNFTVANMTIGEVYYHPIQVQSNPVDADNFKAQNVRFIDSKEQLLKVSGGGDLYADNGIVQCCEFEFTEGIAYQYYTGGIDAHRSNDWVVRYNTFKHIRSPENLLAEHAIHFWQDCSRTIVDANLIINCDRGIGFGLGEGFENGHTGGLIMNNMVHTSRDVGIGLETSTDTKIYNNTLVTENYPRSIEYRFAGTTDALIANNLVNGEISDRSSGSTGILTTNYKYTFLELFAGANDYNYHLDGMPSWIVDQGTYLPEVQTDYDCEARPSSGVSDIGADQAKFVSSLFDRYNQEKISLSPNPIIDSINLSGKMQNAKIEITDFFGISHFNTIAKSDSLSINVQGYPAGIYYIKVDKGNNKIQITKFVKVEQ